jgi:hypothetical protein
MPIRITWIQDLESSMLTSAGSGTYFANGDYSAAANLACQQKLAAPSIQFS